jgi:hypothetical protein
VDGTRRKIADVIEREMVWLDLLLARRVAGTASEHRDERIGVDAFVHERYAAVAEANAITQ